MSTACLFVCFCPRAPIRELIHAGIHSMIHATRTFEDPGNEHKVEDGKIGVVEHGRSLLFVSNSNGVF
jgi:hypothetical protein